MTTEPVEEEHGNWCPVVAASKVLSSVWAIVVIYYLVDGPRGFNELLRTIPGMNSKTLSRTLKLLVSKGLVVREVVSVQPFAVHYRLTPMGEELVPVLNALREWGEKWARPGTAQGRTQIPHRQGQQGKATICGAMSAEAEWGLGQRGIRGRRRGPRQGLRKSR
jgi:DNA-binding HxlR family transcriptional regulator